MYLTEEQLEAIRAELGSQHDEIVSKMHSRQEQDFEPETRGDEADIANSEGIAATIDRLQNRDARLMKKIEGAIRDMDDEDFGYCTVCGDEVGFKRMLARPAAKLCIECKQNQEQVERGYYHPRRRKQRNVPRENESE